MKDQKIDNQGRAGYAEKLGIRRSSAHATHTDAHDNRYGTICKSCVTILSLLKPSCVFKHFPSC